MKVTIQDCNTEARRLWLQAVAVAKAISQPDKHVNRKSVRQQFNYLLAELDKKGQTVTVLTKQISKEKYRYRYKYTYDVQHNFTVVANWKSRNAAKLHVYRLYLKYVKHVEEAVA